MSQFRFINMTMGVSLHKTNRKLEEGRRVDSVAFVKFFVERQTGYFLLQVISKFKMTFE